MKASKLIGGVKQNIGQLTSLVTAGVRPYKGSEGEVAAVSISARSLMRFSVLLEIHTIAPTALA